MSALDELRFGPERTLNLRESLPTAAEATDRAEKWLREHQIKGSEEVLIITGRGNQSPGGVPVLRGAIEKLLFALRRRGVVAFHHDHNPGAFAVVLAPLRSLSDAPARRRDRRRPTPRGEIHGLSSETRELLRDLAQRSLDALGVTQNDGRIEDEMHRYLGVLGPGLPPGDDLETRLQGALRAAIAEYD